MTDQRQEHWNRVYREKPEERLSWHQATPQSSLDALERCSIAPEQSVIDIGGGASVLAQRLLAQGWQDVTVLDISEAALAVAKARLGALADGVRWEVADITQWIPRRRYGVWHDRAVFHFLT